MSRETLTPVSYLVLGLIEFAPATPYELKRRVAQSVGNFWNFPHSQLYAEPARLAQLGLLAEEQEQHGRRRRLYSINEAGRRALHEWAGEPSSEEPQLRDIGLLKLFFSGALPRESVVSLAQAQEQAHRSKLAEYEQIAEHIPDRASTGLATLNMGLAVERTFVEFWSGIAADPPHARGYGAD